MSAVIPWVGDLSYAWPSSTGKVLTSLGAVGAVGYAACDDTDKNVSRDRLHDWLDSGLIVSLVIENGTQDLRGGENVGRVQGQKLYDAATKLGYDANRCVLYTAADWNSRGTDLNAIDDAMGGFSQHVPVPGVYGNSYAIDKVAVSKHADYFWQSNSSSFSYGLSGSTHLKQRFADPRAGGRSIDVNDIKRLPLGMMGEAMPLSPEDIAAVWNYGIKNPDGGINMSAANRILDLETKMNALTSAVAHITPGNVQGEFTITGTGTVS